MALFYKLHFSEIFCNVKEAARYAGYRFNDGTADPQIMNLVKKSCSLLQPALVSQGVYEEFDLTVEPVQDGRKYAVKFADVKIETKDLGFNLKNCEKIILLAATTGPKVDMLIRRAQTSGSADGVFMQGTGAMFIESFVDSLNEKLKKEWADRGYRCHPRYSPGYGDVPLEVQKIFFRLLPCSKIGLSLMESLIMAPEKSVTAFIGLEKLS